LKGSGYYGNHAYLVGGGASARYMFFQKLFVGGTLRTYRAHTTAYENYNAQDQAFNFSVDTDIVFSPEKKLRPYWGVGIGFSRVTHMINYMRVYQTYPIYSIRAGIAHGKSTGFFARMQYNYTPREGQVTDIPGVSNPVLTKTISKYVAIDGGLYVRLYVRK
jgi:opacity protein-like surface antigen